MDHRTRLIVLGRQGAGKGTQCARLAARLSVPHISTGDLFRAEAAKGTELGLRAAVYFDAGSLVPDELVLDLVALHLGTEEARAAGYLLDGFPRTLPQGQALFEVLGKRALDVAVELHVPTSVVLPRLAARRVCKDCGATSQAGADDPETTRCRLCGGTVGRRTDDTDEAIQRRLATYDQESGPLLEWLDNLGLLVRVDGVGEPDAVHHRLLDAVRDRVPAIDQAGG
ncbi:MAG: nucleoside monophosphate kinase [Actinomycetota bacterium]|nr:nucleoside monophosphate kinase [Actinomycetota bacterium]